MKKGTTIALIVAAVMLIVGATLINLARGRGEDVLGFFNGGTDCSFNGGSIQISSDQAGYTVCMSGEESFEAAEVKSLDLDWVSGAVNVEPYDGRQIVIREAYAGTLSEGQRMRWKLSGGTLSVLFCANGENMVPDKDLTVLLPRGYCPNMLDADSVSASVTLRDLTVSGAIDSDTTSGAILVSECSCASLDADTVSGSVAIEDTAVGGAIDVDTTSGAVRLKACSCASLDANTVSGGVEAEDTAIAGQTDVDTSSGSVVMRALGAVGPVDVDTISGSVDLRFKDKPASVDVETSSGEVRLTFPAGTTIELDFDTASGVLSGPYHATPGGVSVDVDTISGDLTICED